MLGFFFTLGIAEWILFSSFVRHGNNEIMKWKDVTISNLIRNNIFRYLNGNVEYRVVWVKTVMVSSKEVPVKIKIQALKSKVFRTLDMDKQYKYDGVYCEAAFRRVEVKI